MELLGRNIAPLYFKTERVPKTLTHIVIFSNFGWIAGFWTLKTEIVAETALRASWFWPTWARFPGAWGQLSSARDYKLTPDGLVLQWNGHRKTFGTLTLELLVQNIAPLHFKTERVAETALRASWFRPTSAQFPGTWGIFSSRVDSKATADGLGLQWNRHSKTFWTLTFELLGRKRAPLYFKSERVAETAWRAWWFLNSSARLARTWGILSSPGTLNYLLMALVFSEIEWGKRSARSVPSFYAKI